MTIQKIRELAQASMFITMYILIFQATQILSKKYNVCFSISYENSPLSEIFIAVGLTLIAHYTLCHIIYYICDRMIR